MIKRFLAVLISISVFLVVLVVYDEAEHTEKSQYAIAADSLGSILEIPNQEGVNDPVAFWPILENAAMQSGVNVFRKVDGFDLNGEPFVAYYVLLTSDETGFYDSFRLRDGRFLRASETQVGSSYLSSMPSDDETQVGVIDDVGRNDYYYIYNLERIFESYKVVGNYIIEAQNEESQSAFYDYLNESFSDAGIDIVTIEANDPTSEDPFIWGYEPGFAERVVWFAIIAVIIMIIYRQISESKRTAVLLLYGNSYLRVWYLVSGRFLIRVSLVLLALVFLSVLLIPGSTLSLVLTAFGKSALALALFIAVSLVTLVLIRKLNIQEALKNRKDTLLLAIGNMILKGALSLALIYMGAVTISHYELTQSQRELWGNWESTSQYGVYYPYLVGIDGMESTFVNIDKIVFDLYPTLNADGALYIWAEDFADYALKDGHSGYRSVTVNPNYLEIYPIKDADGNDISISEDETDWIVLVPESYRAEEREILEYFIELRNGSNGSESVWNLDKEYFGRIVENPQPDQKTRIIWTAVNQEVFSFSPDVYPEEGNNIIDPLIQVTTIGNSSGFDRHGCILGGVGDALKIKLNSGGSAQTYEQYLPLLQEYGLDDNLKQIVTLDEMVFSILQSYDDGLMEYLFQMVLIFILFLALVLQSVSLLFELDARRTAVRKLYGYSFVSRNRFFFAVFACMWAILFIATFVFNSVLTWPWGDYGPQDLLTLFAVAGVFLVIEILISALMLSFVENRRVVDVLKGEF